MIDLLLDVLDTTLINQSLLDLDDLSMVLRSGNLAFGRSLLVGFDSSLDLGDLLQGLARRSLDLGMLVLTLIFASLAILFFSFSFCTSSLLALPLWKSAM